METRELWNSTLVFTRYVNSCIHSCPFTTLQGQKGENTSDREPQLESLATHNAEVTSEGVTGETTVAMETASQGGLSEQGGRGVPHGLPPFTRVVFMLSPTWPQTHVYSVRCGRHLQGYGYLSKGDNDISSRDHLIFVLFSIGYIGSSE